MKNNQRGFGIGLAFVVVLAAALVVLGGMYVWSQRDEPQNVSANTQQNQTPKTYVDTAKKFTFTYPADWKAINPPPCCEGPTPDPAVVSSRIELTYPGAVAKSKDDTTGGLLSKNNILVLPSDTKDRATAYNDTFKDAQKSDVNGYEFLASQSSERYGYQDSLYLISNGTQDIVFRFRAKQTAKAGQDVVVYDERSVLPEIRKIAESVRFQ